MAGGAPPTRSFRCLTPIRQYSWHAPVLPSAAGRSCPEASVIKRRISTLGSDYPGFLDEVAAKVLQRGGNIAVLGYPGLIESPQSWATWEKNVGSC